MIASAIEQVASRIARIPDDALQTEGRAGEVRKLATDAAAGIDQLRDALIRTVRSPAAGRKVP